jgi:hypothetical protein
LVFHFSLQCSNGVLKKKNTSFTWDFNFLKNIRILPVLGIFVGISLAILGSVGEFSQLTQKSGIFQFQALVEKILHCFCRFGQSFTNSSCSLPALTNLSSTFMVYLRKVEKQFELFQIFSNKSQGSNIHLFRSTCGKQFFNFFHIFTVSRAIF